MLYVTITSLVEVEKKSGKEQGRAPHLAVSGSLRKLNVLNKLLLYVDAY